jgi:putative transcriptional regulator
MKIWGFSFHILLYIYNTIDIITNMLSRKLYNRIAVLRKERNISRKELATIIGVNFQTVGYLEREEYNPSLDLALKISEYFGFPIEFIFSSKPLKNISDELREFYQKQEK